MQKDWVAYFKERASAIITQPYDPVTDFAPPYEGHQPPAVVYPVIDNTMNDEEIQRAWYQISVMARHEVAHLLVKVMYQH